MVSVAATEPSKSKDPPINQSTWRHVVVVAFTVESILIFFYAPRGPTVGGVDGEMERGSAVSEWFSMAGTQLAHNVLA